VRAFQQDPQAEPIGTLSALRVLKSRLAQEGDYNLGGERYKEAVITNHQWPMVELGEFLDYEQPTDYIVRSVDYDDNYETPVLTPGKSFILGYTNEKDGIYNKEFPVIIFDDFTTATKLVDFPFKVKSSAMKILHAVKDKVDIKYAFFMMQNISFNSSTHKRYWISEFSKIKIPLPPLEVQQALVDEIEGYQKVIDGARQVVENYKPVIPIDPAWPLVKLGEVCEEIKSGFAYGKSEVNGEGVPHLRPMNINSVGELVWEGTKFIPVDKFIGKEYYQLRKGDVLFNNTNSKELVGKTCFVNEDIEGGYSNHITRIRVKKEIYNPQFLSIFLHYLWRTGLFLNLCNKWVGQAGINSSTLSNIEVPLPPLEVQEELIKQINIEQDQINTNKALIEGFEAKIAARIKNVWDEE